MRSGSGRKCLPSAGPQRRSGREEAIWISTRRCRDARVHREARSYRSKPRRAGAPLRAGWLPGALIFKALGLPDVLRLMVPQLAGFSASSLFEALLVRHVVGPQVEVQVTSPGLRDRDCAELARCCDAISFNSLSQSARLGR